MNIKKIDIRDYILSRKIRKILINCPIELSLLEVTCILINNNFEKNIIIYFNFLF